MTYNPADNLAAYNKKTAWADDDMGLAASMWLKGISALTISKSLDGRHSRNSVISKMQRMGVQTPTLPAHQLYNKNPKPKVKRPIRVRPPRTTIEERVLSMHNRGLDAGDIADRLKKRKHDAVAILAKLGIDPDSNRPVHYKVHPMWSMSEDDRRQAFYAKFQAGWVHVLERLNA